MANVQVSLDSSGSPLYEVSPIWGQTYCIKHRCDGTATCFTCNRLEPFGAEYSWLSDGRRICSDCQRSAITSLSECQPLIVEIQNFYEGLDMKVEQEIPFKLVDLKALNIISTPVFGPGNELTEIVTEPHKLVSYKEVVDIKVLRDTPRLYTGMNLAHEMMHAWLALHGSYLNIRRRCELGYLGNESGKIHEGLCEVMAHIWLDTEIHAMSRSEYISSSRDVFEEKLAHHLKRMMELNRDPTYGDGFRMVHRAVSKYGLKGTLDYIRMTGGFPR
ncbi:hypothetical protein CRG98_044875 [Punica granatum]|uniref:Protein DA1-like domain-containing protein n=1 Tax=Punica granatum TaxID=22663 RepID=A0A2I0HSQ4_PUNGR|nr:hypothetical protein CRG98_044875 [Punica granatum]